ncbi:uncharacterized protein BX664DRAFT_321404, partial [Halteromyces radiatus]|uniref:uncharacterized protein n=1 Tax=Halteromyces radiatus TaxID=101107 RepID=UPI00221E999F
MQLSHAHVFLKVLFTAWLVFLMIFQNFFSTCLDSLSLSLPSVAHCDDVLFNISSLFGWTLFLCCFLY